MKIEYNWTWEQYVNQAEFGERVSKYNTSRSKGFSFTGTNTFQEAITLARNGWQEGRESLAGALQEANTITRNEIETDTSLDIAGMYPLAPLYAAGNDFCMVTENPIPTRPIIRLAVTAKASGSTGSNYYLNYGAALCSYIQQIEAADYRVELNLLMVTKSHSGSTMQALIRVKEADQEIELDRLAYALMHRSTQRRLWFSIIEQHGPFSRETGRGYGQSRMIPQSDPFLAGLHVIDGLTNDSTLKPAMAKLESAVEAIGKEVTKILDNIL